MPKSFNVVLNSNYAYSGNTKYATYMFDWKAVVDPKKQYKLHFTYIGGQNNYNGSKTACIYADFNTSTYFNDVSANPWGASRSQFLGFLKPIVLVGSSNTCYLQAEDNTNLPILLDSPPLNTSFTVRILDNFGQPYMDTATTPAAPAPYVLILKFTEIDEKGSQIE